MTVRNPITVTNVGSSHAPRSFSQWFCRKVTLKVILKIIRSLLVPLLLAIFTVVITFAQRSEARIQRQQDLLLSREQRFEDQGSMRLQRFQELNISIEQRELERELAAKMRALSDEQRLHQLRIQLDDRQNTLFTNYLTEMGSYLLRETNGSSLSSDLKVAALVQAKTLHVIRQIDIIRKRQLIRFLYVSGQLYVNRDPINLFGADLNNINLQGHPLLPNISLAGACLNNASFVGQNLKHANMSNAQINGGNFLGVDCRYINFDYSFLNRSIFTESNCVHASFRHSYLYEADFIKAKAMSTTFDNAYLVHINFSHSNLSNSSFIGTNLAGSFLDGITIENSMKFAKTNLAQIDFTRIRIRNNFPARMMFMDANFVDSSFKGVSLECIQFYYCNMTRVDFSFSTLSRTEFRGSILTNATFSKAWMSVIDLVYTNLTHSNFSNVSCAERGCIWQSALVLRQTMMPNGTIINRIPESFLVNGHADCNTSINVGWTKIDPLNSIILNKTNSGSRCRFERAIHDTDPLTGFLSYNFMSQEKKLDSFYSQLIKEDRALLRVRAQLGFDTVIMMKVFDYRFIHYNDTFEIRRQLPNASLILAQFPLNRLTTNITFTIRFSRYTAFTDAWCDFVEMDIIPLIHAPP